MTRSPSPIDSPPSFRHFGLLAVLIAAEFTVVYYGADWVTVHRALRVHLYGTSELRIPLVPAMVVPYTTMYVIFWFTPFILRNIAELDRFARALAQQIAIAGVCFLLLPAQLGFDTANATGSIWDPWLRFAAMLSRTNNLVPSLHVALFTTAAVTFCARVSAPVRALLVIWLVVVAASTLLTHQHHLIDVVAGLLLGGWGARVAMRERPLPVAAGAGPSALDAEGLRCSP